MKLDGVDLVLNPQTSMSPILNEKLDIPTKFIKFNF
jgi:hypothetical protein